jgi:hypothetical protein
MAIRQSLAPIRSSAADHPSPVLRPAPISTPGGPLGLRVGAFMSNSCDRRFVVWASVVATGAAIVCVPQIMTTPSRDQDVHKGAMEDERPSTGTNAPGLDDEGLPNDDTAIAEDALGAREDGSQG